MTFLKSIVCIGCISIFLGLGLSQKAVSQVQNFETSFAIVSYPDEFLPNWYGNEVRATSSRIFQSSNEGINGGKALAVQPISTFNGVIWILLVDLDPSKKVSFWAKSLQNGSGNRAAEVSYSWGKSLDGAFSTSEFLGGKLEFANEDQVYRKFVLDLPDDFLLENEGFLKLEIRYGEGSGSAARWLLDDFEFGEVMVDSVAPRVFSAKGYDSHDIQIQFDEKVDPVFSLLPPVYSLEGKSPEFIRTLNDSTVVLTFSEELVEDVEYSLQISQLPDLAENVLEDTIVRFTFLDPTKYVFKSIVINELMPAPRADLDLPNVEYLELFNPTSQEWRTGGLKLANSRGRSVIEDFWINPGEFLLLVPKGQESQFKELGKVLGVTSWPAMLNSGDQMSLLSPEGMVIDQIEYTTSSWVSSELANNGYSLEVVNPYFQCDNSSFILSSTGPLRGTPGQVNSVFDSLFAAEPQVMSRAYFLDSLTFQLEFSGPISSNISPSQIRISPSLAIDSIAPQVDNSLVVFLGEAVLPNVIFQVSISDLLDCTGNVIGELGPIEMVWARKAGEGDLILNELLFDPIPGDPKFVEVFNRSEEFLDLEGWAIANLDSDGKPAQVKIFGTKGLVIEPKGYLAINTSTELLKIRYPKSQSGKYLEIPSLPSYPISGGSVVLISSAGEFEEVFNYSEKLHHPLLRNPKGVSLERIMDQNGILWQSASANEDYATPGRKNSQNLEVISGEETITISPEVFDPEGSSGPSFATIEYKFSDPGWVGTFQIFTAGGQKVAVLAQNQNLGTSGSFIWQGVGEDGQRVKPGYYILLADLYHLNGKTLVIKKSLVVGARL